MAGRRVGLVGLLICLCLFVLPCRGLAASTADAKEFIDTGKSCSLTLSYGYDGTAFPDISVKLYKIADVSDDFQYTLTGPFQATSLALNGVESNVEWNIIRSTLEAHITADCIPADTAAVTDQYGQVCFGQLVPGLYLAVPANVPQSYFFGSALVALPGLGVDGLWQYDVTVTAKGEFLPPAQPDDQIQLKILKLWRGDEGNSHRPRSVEMEIFRDGTVWQTVTLSPDNNWSYSWTAQDDRAVWTVMERNVPSGYAVTVEKRETSFVVTNTLITEDDGQPKNQPKTGDTSNILLYTMVMYLSGTALVLLGLSGKRKCL